MESHELGQHIHQQFDAELERLRTLVLKTGGLVESQLEAALAAFSSEDGDRAEAVVRDDRKINSLELEIDELCTSTLALRQPMARDLRLIVAVIKMTNDLERMGDEAVRVARMAIRVAERKGEAGGPSRRGAELRHLGGRVRHMLRDALDSFARVDLELAWRVITDDAGVDREFESISREQLTFMMEDARSIPRAMDIMFAARALERIGDRACNVAEQVIYLSKGKDVRHSSLENRLSEAGVAPEDPEEGGGI